MKKPIKALIVGDSKAGKSGAQASLLLAGYHLRVVDMDNGMDIILGIPEIKKNIAKVGERVDGYTLTLRNGATLDTRVCTDGIVEVQRKNIIAGRELDGLVFAPDGTAWSKAMRLMREWPGEGPVRAWRGDRVLSVDSLSFLSQAALNFQVALNNRVGQRPFDTDIGDAQTLVRGFLGKVSDVELACNVLVITHLDYRGGDLFKPGADKPNRPAPKPDHADLSGVEKGYPMTLGKALNSVVGRSFNTLLVVKTVGTKRVIHTRNTSVGSAQVDCASIDLDIPTELPLETGLADYFRAVRGPLRAEEQGGGK